MDSARHVVQRALNPRLASKMAPAPCDAASCVGSAVVGGPDDAEQRVPVLHGKGLHSSTFQLNPSISCH